MKLKMKGQRGLSMIEILITILIVAIGFLGVAGMQLLNLKTVNNTQFRTFATLHAYDMAERMRSNKTAVNAGAYNISARPSSGQDCSGGCNMTQLATSDLYDWNNQIRAYNTNDASASDLPNGKGTIVQSGNFYDITISWQEQSRDSGVAAISDEEFVLRVKI